MNSVELTPRSKSRRLVMALSTLILLIGAALMLVGGVYGSPPGAPGTEGGWGYTLHNIAAAVGFTLMLAGLVAPLGALNLRDSETRQLTTEKKP